MSASVLVRENKLAHTSHEYIENLYPFETIESELEDDLSALDTIPGAAFVELTLGTGSGKTQAAFLHVLMFSLNEKRSFILRKCSRKDKKTLNALVVESQEVAQRVINAWKFEAAEQLIATACILGDELKVTDCALDTWKIPFSILPALKDIPIEERVLFEVDEDGSYLYWSSSDTHLDMESLRACVDSELRERLNAEKLLYDQRFGQAVAAVRKRFQLRQSDISGVSARHVQRIEKGEANPKIDTLEKLANSHKLTLDEYLNEIAHEARKLV